MQKVVTLQAKEGLLKTRPIKVIEHRATSVALLLRPCPSCTVGLTTSTLWRTFSLPPLMFGNLSQSIPVRSHRAPHANRQRPQAVSSRIGTALAPV